MVSEETAYDLGKNVDMEELLSHFVEIPRDYTEPEKALKKELNSLRKMRRSLNELIQIRKEEKSRVVVKTGEKAKEEAMELLRSGAIQIEDKKERHTFKRKFKDSEDDESVRTPTVKDKNSLYTNFLRGPKLLPQVVEPQTPVVSTSDEHTSGVNRGDLFTTEIEANYSASAIEAAASKRKQQLIALSEGDELEDGDARDDARKNKQIVAPVVDEMQHRFPMFHGRQVESTLYVGYHRITTNFIYDTFEPIGEIMRVRIAEHQNHAYVTMATHEMAEKALELDHRMINNRLLRVGFARKPFARLGRDQRQFRPFSPHSHADRGHFPILSHHTVPPAESTLASIQTSRDLVTYEDLNFKNDK